MRDQRKRRKRAARALTAGAVGVWLAALAWSVSPGGLQAAAGAQTAPGRASGRANVPAAHREFFERYCLTCHNEGLRSRDVVSSAFDRLDLAQVGADAATWEKMAVQIRAGLMPPSGAMRAEPAVEARFATWLESELDRAAAARPDPGRTDAVHRLNRSEYRNAIRDLLGLDVDVDGWLPADEVSRGFDNLARALTISPTLMERYLSAAQRISRLALGTPPATPTVDYYRVPDDLRQDDHLPDLPLGTRGGMRVRHFFPVDGQYVIRVRLAGTMTGDLPAFREPQHLEVSLDGERLQVFTLLPASGRPAGNPQANPQGNPQANPQSNPQGNPRAVRNRADHDWDFPVRVTAGYHNVIATFLMRTAAVDETVRRPFIRPYPQYAAVPDTRMSAHLRDVEISGPHGTAERGASPSRARILVCDPATAPDEEGCARDVLSTLARRAYRRPATSSDVEPLLARYREGRRRGGVDAGLDLALRQLLVGPEFLFRIERDPPAHASGAPYPVSDLELASRLSFFLWSSIPDDELLELAEAGRLRTPGMLERQVRRMLEDPRGEAFVRNFADQWLRLRHLSDPGPVPRVFPDFDGSLRQALRRETELFLGSIVRDDRSALELLSADYSFLNERLARHYGVPNVKGSHFRRVTFGAGSVRGGLLGHGSMLTVTSQPNRTSPVARGMWIMENLLGTPPPPAPDEPQLPTTDENGRVLSMRERLQTHRTNARCANCHSMMDSLGLALENFNGIGQWRHLDESGTAIDASAVLPDGTAVTGPSGLRAALLSRSHRVVTTLTEKLLTYALGRELQHADAPAVRAIVRDAARRDYRVASELILGVVQSMPFQMRRPQS